MKISLTHLEQLKRNIKCTHVWHWAMWADPRDSETWKQGEFEEGTEMYLRAHSTPSVTIQRCPRKQGREEEVRYLGEAHFAEGETETQRPNNFSAGAELQLKLRSAALCILHEDLHAISLKGGGCRFKI